MRRQRQEIDSEAAEGVLSRQLRLTSVSLHSECEEGPPRLGCMTASARKAAVSPPP